MRQSWLPLQYLLQTHGKTRLVQYVITAKNPFKTSVDSLQVMLSNFKNNSTRFLSAGLRPAVRPTISKRMGPVFCHIASDRCLITRMLF